MVKTKKRKKVRKNTRVFRCLQKVKKTRKIGAAIAICQSSTKQNYRTGKRLKNKKTKKGGGKSKKTRNPTGRGRGQILSYRRAEENFQKKIRAKLAREKRKEVENPEEEEGKKK